MISSIHSREEAEDDGKTSIDKSDFPDDPGNVSEPEKNKTMIIIAAIIVSVAVLVVGAIGVVYIYSRRSNNSSYLNIINVTNNKNTRVHNYQDCNVQIGDKNTQNVHEFVSENESASSADE